MSAKVGDTEDQNFPTPRDAVIRGDAPEDNKIAFLLLDLIRLEQVVHNLLGKEEPSKAEDLKEPAERVLKVLKHGKSYELAGIKDVPKPFTKSTGRIMTKEGESWKELNDEEALKELSELMFQKFKTDEVGELLSPHHKDMKEALESLGSTSLSAETNSVDAPDTKDAVFFKVGTGKAAAGDKIYEQQGGNKAIFGLASQLVTSYTNSAAKRVDAALSITRGLSDMPTKADDGDTVSNVNRKARFLVRSTREDDVLPWNELGVLAVATELVIFVFEVFLEKELHIRLVLSGGLADLDVEDAKAQEAGKPSTSPVDDPTDHDVMFGRGGLTNSHPGNRRFRDVIALHRPDYIRAIKMDKPAVARKIVKAIRMGNPPGRFLKKGDDGKWYDVGDRAAAEKTSQGLRERSNAEKRQRSALREALRIRKQDMVEDDEPNKRARLGEAGSSIELAASITPTLNYIGTNLPVPLSLNMKEPAKIKRKDRKVSDNLNTEGLPPNAVDPEGNILVTDHDILCGRGGLTNHHKGNKRFRDIVALHRADYVRAPKVQKPSVARVIVRAIRNGDPPGRFLRKDEKTGRWFDVGDKKAAEKTSQALREKTNEEREKLKGDPAALGVLLPNPASYLAAVTATPMFASMATVVVPPTETVVVPKPEVVPALAEPVVPPTEAAFPKAEPVETEAPSLETEVLPRETDADPVTEKTEDEKGKDAEGEGADAEDETNSRLEIEKTHFV